MSLAITEPIFWLYVVNITLVLSVILHMLYQRRSPQNLMAWLLTLILLPYIGVFLYLILGSRKFLKKHRKPTIAMLPSLSVQPQNHLAIQLNNILQTNQIAGATANNQVKMYPQDHKAYKQILHEIAHAQSSIHIETYIFELDNTGQQILQALISKAKQGVEVCLLLDALGSFSLYINQKKLKPLISAGGKYGFFQPLWPSIFSGQINLRNHRKIYLFDQTTLLTGGMNLSDDYLGLERHLEQEPRWIDLMFEIKGPITFHYQNVFNDDWYYATTEKLTTPKTSKPENLPVGEVMQVVPSGPDIHGDALYESLLNSIYFAKQQIHIVTPYFIPDSSIMNALLIAIKRRVEVTLLTPETSDHLIFDLGRSSYMRELSEAGANVQLFKNNMLHSKLIIIDQQVTIIGSANFDYRSLFINHEIVNFVYSASLTQSLLIWLNKQLEQSQAYKPNHSAGKRLLENLARIFAPIL